ncbi:MAG: squalene/phytoene synthase family protein [Bacteroidetes bacterium]|nr:squalene/phytoene synthase family protein [Bacteroidota bacterium]MBL7105031.1 squalene/phytoene synthase family protein [Bacteroidales bacterium]
MNTNKLNISEIIQNIDFEKIMDHPNIIIAAQFWEDDRYNAAMVCYKFMRKIDDMIDDRKSNNVSLTQKEKQLFTDKVNYLTNSLNDPSLDNPFIKEVTKTITRFNIPVQIFQNFARSMIYDINHNGFPTLNDFLEYSEGASVAPASVFVHLCCLNKDTNDYVLPSFNVIEVARPCAIFSYLVHIIRDFRKDQYNNLNYFALDILEKNNLTPSDLTKIANESQVPEAFRNVIKEYYSLAELYKLETIKELEKLNTQLEPRYLLSLYLIFDLYLQIFERIDISSGNFTDKELNPTPLEIKERVMEVISKNQTNRFC